MKRNNPKKKNGVLSTFGLSVKKWDEENLPLPNEINMGDSSMLGAGITTVASLLNSGNELARSRQSIYDMWSQMESDPIISSALKILVTASLGGHETSGDVVFLEKRPQEKSTSMNDEIIEDLQNNLLPIFNKIAFTQAYLGAAFGDSYARIYSVEGQGVVDLYNDELVRPTIVQPFVRGSRTIGYAVYLGEKNFERLNSLQMARLKMPRTQWIPQLGVIEKSMKYSLEEDDVAKLPVLPDVVGGSFLYSAEKPYSNLISSLLGLVGHRWMDSIDEQLLTVNLQEMTKAQQKTFLDSLKKMLKRSQDIASNAVKRNQPVMERIRHIVPTFGDKQVTQISGGVGGSRTTTMTIEDIMLHAKLLAGSLGVDLSMLGFADQLSGGLGEGGFFRASAQIAERARLIRGALTDFFNSIIDIHTRSKYGIVYSPNKRPYSINFYGSISALESEKQQTRMDSMNAGLLLVQAMQQFKDLGVSKESMSLFLTQVMLLDENLAEQFAEIVVAGNDDNNDDDNDDNEGGLGGAV